jgi:phosphoglycolate phosphatase
MDDAERWKLVPMALQRAGDKLGRSVTPEHTILIGDTPLDVEAAHRAGTDLIAVATGASSVAELRAAGARTVLADLADTERVLRAVRKLA